MTPPKPPLHKHWLPSRANKQRERSPESLELDQWVDLGRQHFGWLRVIWVCFLVGLLLGFLFSSFRAWGATTTPAGVLRGVVFEGKRERPKPGVLVNVIGTKHKTRTDSDGAFFLRLPHGTYKLRLHTKKHGILTTKAIPVVSDEVTEAVISLRKGKNKQTIVDVEAAVRKRVRLTRKKFKGPWIKVEGRVINKKNNDPIRNARIYVRGFSMEVISRADGTFHMKLPTGTYDITVIHPKFATASLRKMAIKASSTPRMVVKMAPAALRLKTFTVLAPKIEGSTVELMRQRQNASSVSEVLGAQEMSRTGDSNAASALKRVSGVTLVGGKYIYVRGLGERYSSALLNGSTLPSPEPERRVVPLDLFPAGVLEKVVIEKTYLPYMPGEFAGGSVQLYTRGFPTAFRASIKLSLGLTMGASFTNGIQYNGGPLDILGIDGGYRALPKTVYEATRNSPLAEKTLFSKTGYTAKELEQFGESMPRDWQISRKLIAPDWGLALTIGDSFKIGSTQLGYFASLTYSNSWNTTNPQLDIYILGQGNKLELAHSYAFETVENNIRLGGMLVLGANFTSNHRFRSTTLINRITENETRLYEGSNRDVGGDIRVSRLRWIEQMLLTQQFRLLNTFPTLAGLSLDWRYTYSMATRIEPDRRETRYDRDETDENLWILSDRPEGNQRFFNDLFDNNHDIGFDGKLAFQQWSGQMLKVRFGGVAVFKDRRSDTRRFKFLHKGPRSTDTTILSKPTEEIFVPENIGSDGFQLGEITRQTDNYNANQQIAAAYAMVNIPLAKGLRIIGGARLEYSRQAVETFELFVPNPTPVVANLETFDILPALALSWSIGKGMVLRFAGARTVSRPDFRELSPATFNDVTGGRLIFGNEKLERAIIWHADARWEWYLGRGESLSIAAFYKRFERPIETIVVVSAQHSITYENALGAHNLGAELDFRKKFGFLHKHLRDLYIAGNITWVWSQIDLDASSGIQTSNSRPLQGQSPFVINLQLGYDNVDTGTRAALLYNVFGARISSVGALGAPDVFEQPYHQLDLVFRQTIGKGFSLSFKAKNLLDLPVVFTQGEKVTRTWQRGRSFSLGLTYNFK